MKKIILLAVIGLISIVSFILIFHKNQKVEDEMIDNSWLELVEFANNNTDEISQVSQILLKNKDKINMEETPLNYEILIMHESETVKENFEKVFKTLSFSYEAIIQKRDNTAYYHYRYVDGTSYGVVYFAKDGNEKQDDLSFMKSFGEVIQITDAIYVYSYRLPYV